MKRKLKYSLRIPTNRCLNREFVTVTNSMLKSLTYGRSENLENNLADPQFFQKTNNKKIACFCCKVLKKGSKIC